MQAPPLEQTVNAPLAPEAWLATMETEYLEGFIPAGGSAVRFVSGDDRALDLIRVGLAGAAKERQFHFVELDPSKLDDRERKPDYHRIDHFFFAVSQTLDWEALSRSQLVAEFGARGIRFPAEGALTDYEAVAQFNGLEPADLRNRYERLITDLRLRDLGMAVELRIALTALGRAQLIPSEMSPTTGELLLAWLRGERAVPGAAPTLKKIGIYSRIGRTNARSLFESLVHWLKSVTGGGLVVLLDFRPYERVQISRAQRARRDHEAMLVAIEANASAEDLRVLKEASEFEGAGVRYGQAAYIQALEFLRHFIDEIERLEGFTLVVLGSRAFFDDRPKLVQTDRRFFDYNALQTRIGLEVHDAQRQNPSAPLVHLGAK